MAYPKVQDIHFVCGENDNQTPAHHALFSNNNNNTTTTSSFALTPPAYSSLGVISPPGTFSSDARSYFDYTPPGMATGIGTEGDQPGFTSPTALDASDFVPTYIQCPMTPSTLSPATSLPMYESHAQNHMSTWQTTSATPTWPPQFATATFPVTKPAFFLQQPPLPQFMGDCVDFEVRPASRQGDSSGYGHSEEESKGPHADKKETLRKRRHRATASDKPTRRHRSILESEVIEGSPCFVKTEPGQPQAQQAGSEHRLQTLDTRRPTTAGRIQRRNGSGASDQAIPSEPTPSDDEYDGFDTRLETPEEHKARTMHNRVEQKYRKRLNAQFERLLAALPPRMEDSSLQVVSGGQVVNFPDDEGRISLKRQDISSEAMETSREKASDRERRVSKAEVLDRARLHIETLERERRCLEKQREELMKKWHGYGETAG